MKIYSFLITSTPTAYATNDTTLIHHVYKPDCAVCLPCFHDRKLGPVCHQIGGRFRFSFLSGLCLKNISNPAIIHSSSRVTRQSFFIIYITRLDYSVTSIIFTHMSSREDCFKSRYIYIMLQTFLYFLLPIF